MRPVHIFTCLKRAHLAHLRKQSDQWVALLQQCLAPLSPVHRVFTESSYSELLRLVRLEDFAVRMIILDISARATSTQPARMAARGKEWHLLLVALLKNKPVLFSNLPSARRERLCSMCVKGWAKCTSGICISSRFNRKEGAKQIELLTFVCRPGRIWADFHRDVCQGDAPRECTAGGD